MSTNQTVDEKDQSQRHHKPPSDGSPITIGGGGGLDGRKFGLEGPNVSCCFRSGDYPDPGGGPGKKKFQHPGWQIRTLVVGTSNGEENLSSLLPADGKCQIVVRCSGVDDDVTILGKHFGIEMNDKTYQQGGDPNLHTNPDEDGTIFEIEAVGFDYRKFFGPGDHVYILADHI